MSIKQFFDSCEYYESLTKWVNSHPNTTYKEYIKTRNQLRKEYNVEFIAEWRQKKKDLLK